ncbi:SEC-C metal-binding domain-containing protein [Azonexus fungiphilus]|uniref:SEC-C metal-binding domain-containing protein n=1 Tax=Azonexus fungiphilus TaxID=146940 RepID=UPI00156AC752|nr:SEC-C metal-binding domain-containing protein [Azonexus fungiphilus]NHC06875.1 hypothetical protein [Azonexus fungiphilus]
MNDLELARLISGEVGENFTLAKEAAEEYPGYCLVTLRGMCKLICLRIIEARNLAIPKAGELDTLIREVCDRTNPDSQTKNALHKLRCLGNKGAHPEENKLGNAELSDFARSALRYAITALKFAHTQIHPNSPLPAEIVSTAAEFGVKSLCYRATIQEEVEPQYWLGKHFLSKAASLGSGGEDQFIFPHEIHEELKKANYWFRLAANQGHAAALYEHGKLLIDQVDGEEYVAMGVNNIFRAANEGNSDANADVGHIYYHGAHDQPQDFVEARKHFEIAAAEDHPSALTMLGVMYLRGEGGPANLLAAFEYTKKSAEAGYPTGQMNMFVHYWNGEIVEKDSIKALDWLNKAADQNLPEALFMLAEIIQAGLVPEKTQEDAEGLLSKCMSSSNAEHSLRSKAAFQYARLLSRHSDQLQSLTGAADILQRCYEAEKGEGEVAQACLELAQSVVPQIKGLIRSRRGTAEEIVVAENITNYYFDPSGKPIPKRSVGFDKQRQTMREMSEAQKHLSPELYQRRLMEKMTPTLHAQIKRANALKVVSTSRSKIGRNDPCPCNSGKKFKLCCGNN